MKRFSLSKTSVAAITFGLFVLMVAALATSRRSHGGGGTTVVITDTMYTDSVSKPKKTLKATKGKRKRGTTSKKVVPRKAPEERRYLEERVDSGRRN